MEDRRRRRLPAGLGPSLGRRRRRLGRFRRFRRASGAPVGSARQLRPAAVLALRSHAGGRLQAVRAGTVLPDPARPQSDASGRIQLPHQQHGTGALRQLSAHQPRVPLFDLRPPKEWNLSFFFHRC